jgi:hypothetical protein
MHDDEVGFQGHGLLDDVRHAETVDPDNSRVDDLEPERGVLLVEQHFQLAGKGKLRRIGKSQHRRCADHDDAKHAIGPGQIEPPRFGTGHFMAVIVESIHPRIDLMF